MKCGICGITVSVADLLSGQHIHLASTDTWNDNRDSNPSAREEWKDG